MQANSRERGVEDKYWGEEVRQRHVEAKSLCSASAGGRERQNTLNLDWYVCIYPRIFYMCALRHVLQASECCHGVSAPAHVSVHQCRTRAIFLFRACLARLSRCDPSFSGAP